MTHLIDMLSFCFILILIIVGELILLSPIYYINKKLFLSLIISLIIISILILLKYISLDPISINPPPMWIE